MNKNYLILCRECLRLLKEAEHHSLADFEGRIAVVKAKSNAHCNIGHVLLRMGLMQEAGEAYARGYHVAQNSGDDEGQQLAAQSMDRLNYHLLVTDSMVSGPGQQQRWLIQSDDRKQHERVGRRARHNVRKSETLPNVSTRTKTAQQLPNTRRISTWRPHPT